jgi:hypothetical protein
MQSFIVVLSRDINEWVYCVGVTTRLLRSLIECGEMSCRYCEQRLQQAQVVYG